MAQKITEIEASLADWDFLKQLPAEVEGFKLQAGTGIDGQILNIAAYVNEKKHCRLDLIYTSETFDYVPVKTIGLHTFRDVRYFNRDKDKFAETMLAHLSELLAEVGRSRPQKLGYEARKIGFATWNYWHNLLPRIGGYELFITPDNPVMYINGSVIFLDYTDFSKGNQIVFMYNSFRNELFAEMKKGHLPLTTNQFDVKSLKELSVLLKEKLESTLIALEK